MKAKISYEGMQRIERYFVPEDALREALLNALCHKQYQSGVPIQISVYDDKMYIANCGCLPENWTLENLMHKHASSPYNPNIAHVFYLAGFIESWGRGIEKICSACQKDGVPQPVYTINPGDITVSYTHLDVYKRQAEDAPWVRIPFRRATDCQGKGCQFFQRNHTDSVSYTHLCRLYCLFQKRTFVVMNHWTN